jgi:hypothetical protein
LGKFLISIAEIDFGLPAKPLHPFEKSEELHQEMRFSWIEDTKQLKSAAFTGNTVLKARKTRSE